MFGDENDYKFQMEIDAAKHMDVAPEVAMIDTSHAHSDHSLYDSRNGFSDIEIMASLKGFTEDVPIASATQDSVTEFIVQSDTAIQFDSMGDPVQHQVAEHTVESLPTSLESISADTLAMFDQQNNR